MNQIDEINIVKKFSGAKIALIKDDKILSILRDDIPELKFANMWDLVGGGREANETPFECVAREAFEELHIKLDSRDVLWAKEYTSVMNEEEISYFMVGNMTEEHLNGIIMGDEGQEWKLFSIQDFLNDDDVIELFKDRLREFFAERKHGK